MVAAHLTASCAAYPPTRLPPTFRSRCVRACRTQQRRRRASSRRHGTRWRREKTVQQPSAAAAHSLRDTGRDSSADFCPLHQHAATGDRCAHVPCTSQAPAPTPHAPAYSQCLPRTSGSSSMHCVTSSTCTVCPCASSSSPEHLAPRHHRDHAPVLTTDPGDATFYTNHVPPP